MLRRARLEYIAAATMQLFGSIEHVSSERAYEGIEREPTATQVC